MNRAHTLRLAPLVVVVAALAFAFAPAARAWCDWEAGWPDRDDDGDGDALLPYRSALLFEASTDMEAWDDVIGELSLSADPGAHDNWRDVVEHWMDSAAQSWNRTARSPVKVAFAGFADGAAVDVDDGRSSFVASACIASTAGAIPGVDRKTCDIEFCRNVSPQRCDTSADCEFFGGICRDGQCADPGHSFDERSALDDGRGGGLQRTLRHEIGHCLGLYHPCADEGERQPYCDDVCFEGSLMFGPTSDAPHGDDIEGIQMTLRADVNVAGDAVVDDDDTADAPADPAAIFASCMGAPATTQAPSRASYDALDDVLPRREIVLTRLARAPGGFISLNDVRTHVTSAYLPRLDCTHNTEESDVDCVMVRAFDDDELRVQTINADLNGNPQLSPAIAIHHVHTRRSPDIALSRATDTAVAVVSTVSSGVDEVCKSDAFCAHGFDCIDGICRKPCSSGCNDDEPCDAEHGWCTTRPNRLRPVVAHRFAQLDDDGPIAHSQVALPIVSANDPRVAFVRGRGFLVVVTRLDRSPALFLSANDGRTFVELAEQAPEPQTGPPTTTAKLSQRRFFETFDVHCPTHVDLLGASGADALEDDDDERVCQIVFDPFDDLTLDDDSVAGARATTPTGKHVACAVRIGDLGYRVVGCSDPTAGIGSMAAPLASISDYGTGVPSSQLGGRHWIISTAARTPHLAPLQVNSWLGMWKADDDGPRHGVLSPELRDPASLVHSIDAGRECASMTSSDKPMSYFGGTSVEYCEDCRALLVARWGRFDGGDVPENACY